MKSFIIIACILSICLANPQLRFNNPYSVDRTPALIAPQVPSQGREIQSPIQSRPVQRSDNEKDAVILRYENDNIGVDGYNYLVETSDGQVKSEQAQVINQGTDAESIVVRGQFSYVGRDGIVYTVTYTADDDGFHPEGAHLPVAQ